MFPNIDSKNLTKLNELKDPKESLKKPFKVEIVWRNIFLMIILHSSAVYGLYLYSTKAQLKTIIAVVVFKVLSGMGITAGAHRLWCHRSYKANLPLRIILMVLNTMALQNDIYEWSRDHRVHHKYSETDADPHNSNRGFFFAHMGWLLCKKHPQVIEKGKTIDMSDIWNDPVVRFQRRFYFPLITIFCFIVPALIPYYFWKENIMVAFFTCSMYRYCFVLHVTWFVNSWAHLAGKHPYDKNIKPAENMGVVVATFGEGYHNYHHVFPYDYSTSEHGWKYNFNFTTFFIDSFAMIGWVTDRKKVPRDVVLRRQEKTGELLDITPQNKEGFSLMDWIIYSTTLFALILLPPILARTLILIFN